MKIQLASPIQLDSIVDGEGIRTVIWTQGCSHHCAKCHNPETHDFQKGFEMDTEEIKQLLSKINGQDGITLSGGDPLFQIEACLDIAKHCKKLGLSVWCYTGFTFEELRSMAKINSSLQHFLEHIDVLIDGKYEEKKKTFNLPFRGSSNQRILDIPESLKQGKVIEIETYQSSTNSFPTYQSSSHTNQGIYL